MNCNASVHDVPMLRYYSVLGELSYIKRKVHENFMCQMQDRQGKFDGYVSCTFPYLLILQKISGYIFPVQIQNSLLLKLFECIIITSDYSI